MKYLTRTTEGYEFNYEDFKEDIPVVVQAMDNVIDKTVYPLKEQETEAKNKRRMGLGVTALANAGEACGYVYGSPEFLQFADKVLSILANEAYRASALLAKDKGAFPLYSTEYLQSKYLQRLDPDVFELIKQYGIRNSHLTSIAPTGTISLSADNVSSGIEPVFSHYYDRTIQTEDGPIVERVDDYGVRVLGVKGRTADECTVQEHLDVLIVAAQWMDSAVSKTLNVGDDVTWSEFKSVYMRAWEEGAKGCTTFRASGERYGILNKVEEKVEEGAACYYDPATGKKTCDV